MFLCDFEVLLPCKTTKQVSIVKHHKIPKRIICAGEIQIRMYQNESLKGGFYAQLTMAKMPQYVWMNELIGVIYIVS